MASSQLSRRPVRRAVRVWGSARVAEAGITADEERRLRTRGLPEVAGIASLTKSEAKRDTREIEKAAHWLGASGGGRAGGAGGGAYDEEEEWGPDFFLGSGAGRGGHYVAKQPTIERLM